jgi:hypothetical protein
MNELVHKHSKYKPNLNVAYFKYCDTRRNTES